VHAAPAPTTAKTPTTVTFPEDLTEDYQEFAEQIWDLIEDITQGRMPDDVAAQCGLNKGQVFRLMNRGGDKTGVTLKTLWRLTHGLGLNLTLSVT
jgi:DNA-binding phage protein